MKLKKDINILIIGLGIIGGSYAMALKKQGYYVSAITKEKSDIDYALKNKIIDYGTTEIEEDLIGNSDLVIFALYPGIFIGWLTEHQHLFKSGAILTDVTGVKSCIVHEIQSLLREDIEFIAAHPMAGKELSGVQNSDDSIFKGANYIVVPTDKNSESAIELCSDLGKALGFKDISVLSPEKHDEMIAFLSQLTHCIAVSLMCCSDGENLERYTGDSFRDLTRIARINDLMWSELFSLNKDALLSQMDKFKNTFEELYKKIKSDDIDGVRKMMRYSTERRKLFDKTN